MNEFYSIRNLFLKQFSRKKLGKNLIRPTYTVRSASTNTDPHSALTDKKFGKYYYVNNEELSMDFSEITNRAAQTIFWTELFRGAAVTLAHIFKEPATINYPFEKGPLSPRFRGEHALRRYPSGKISGIIFSVKKIYIFFLR